MGEHDHHRQRVFNRVLNEGLQGFEEHNALELLLFFHMYHLKLHLLSFQALDNTLNLYLKHMDLLDLL